ncbi:MAG: tyrosine-protein phosphatase [Planctomycetota bacterium]
MVRDGRIRTGPLRRGAGLSGVLLMVAIGGLGAWWAAKVVWPTVVPKRFVTVIDGEMYRSGELSPAALSNMIEKHGIRTVIDLGAFKEGTKEDALQQRTADAMGATRYRFKLYGDSGGNPNHYAEALRLMTDPANHPVLVHCGAGTERTGCTIALYRQIYEGQTLEEAFAEADDRGHSPTRNPKLWYTLDVFTGPVRTSIETGEPVELPPGFITYEQWLERGGTVGQPVELDPVPEAESDPVEPGDG